MARRRGGDKRSSWLTFQRRLFLVRRLVREPAGSAALIAAARAAFDDEIYPPDAGAALRHDLSALRTEFGCEIRLERDRRYHLDSLGRLAVLDLPDADLEALAFLIALFDDTPLPNAARVAALLERVAGLLPEPRRSQLRPPAIPRLDQPQPTATPAARTLQLLKRALGRQRVSFAYRSTFAQDGAPVRHVAAPYDLFFRDGHTYLEGYCEECGLSQLVGTYVLYRLDRIDAESVRLLPQQLPPAPPPRRTYALRYQISAAVARQRDLALWFPESEVTFDEGGAATVSARTSDLWQARQVLLRYREHCRVLEPPELVAMMQESAERIAAVYRPDPGA